MQSYTEIPSTQSLQSSLALLLSNDKTAISSSSGTAFPTTNLQIGMLCFRTDQNKLYVLRDMAPTWSQIADAAASNWNSLNDGAGSGMDADTVDGIQATTTATANSLLALDANSKLPASVTGSATSLETARTINGTSFNGTANITTANWGTARTINGTSINGSADVTTANWGAERTLTIGSSSKAVSGSGNVSWSLAEIGAQAALVSGANIKTVGGTSLLGSGDVGVGGCNGQVFTSSGTFTVPTGVSAVKVTLISGGGGSRATNYNQCAGGGGGGGVAIKYVTGLTPGSTVTVTVGAAGGVSGSGGTSSFGSHCSVTGGAVGGSVVSDTGTSPGGAGGVATNASAQINGGAGGSATVTTTAYGHTGTRGSGGTSFGLNGGIGYFGGSAGSPSGPNGSSATGYGNGASGSFNNPGYSGSPGIVFVEW
jgi:hypothetical protein